MDATKIKNNIKSINKKYRENGHHKICESDDFEIDRSMYYLGRALYRFSLIQMDKRKIKSIKHE